MDKKLVLDVSKTKGFYDEALYNEVKKEVLAAQKVLMNKLVQVMIS